MSGLNEFKAELRIRTMDFATVYQLVSNSVLKTQDKKDETNQKAYDRLERFILESFNTWIMDNPKKVQIEPEIDPEDTTISLDF